MDDNKIKDIPENKNLSESVQDEANITEQDEGVLTVAPEDEEGVLITAPEEDDTTSSEEHKEELCILCEKNAPDKSYGEDYDLCSECRHNLIRSRFRFKGILSLIAILGCVMWSFTFLANQGTSIEAINEGYKQLKDGNLNSAIGSFSTVSNLGWKTARKLVDACIKLGSVDDANYLLTSYFYDETATDENGQPVTLLWTDKIGKSDINSSINKDIKATSDFINRINEYANEYSGLFYQYYEKLYYGEIKPDDVPYDDIIKQYDEEEAKAETNEEKGIITYYKLATSSICNKEPEIQYDYCTKLAELLPECKWMYEENLVMLSIQMGKYDEATALIAEMRSTNPGNAYLDLYDGLNLRYQGKYSEAIKIFEEIIADIENNQILDAYYEVLVCHFVTGNYEKAYEYAKLCFENREYLTYEILYFYAMLSEQLGIEGGYQAAADLLASNNEKLSPTVDKYIAGEITAEQLFKNGEVVFE